MDDSLYFDEHHLAVREMVRSYARDEVAPIAARYDASADFPWESIRRMSELGLLGVTEFADARLGDDLRHGCLRARGRSLRLVFRREDHIPQQQHAECERHRDQ